MESQIGIYELVAFTKKTIGDLNDENDEFTRLSNDVMHIFTSAGHYSYENVINPFETLEIKFDDDTKICYLFDEYKREGVDFSVDGKKYALLVCMEIFESEIKYIKENTAAEFIDMMKKKNIYPYTDMDRAPIV